MFYMFCDMFSATNNIFYGYVESNNLTAVKNCTDFDVTEDDNRAIRLAAMNGYIDMAKYLIERGADIKDGNNHSLQLACLYDQLDMVKFLISKGADVCDKKNTALVWSCASKNWAIVEYLVYSGAPLNLVPEQHQEFIRACNDTRIQSLTKAHKIIYFWWIRKCYNTNNTIGQRMMLRNYNEYKKICEIK